MAATQRVRELSTGHVMLFDEQSHELFLIDGDAGWTESGSVDAARDLVKKGQARHFRRQDVEAINDALTHIAFLG